MLFLYFYVTMIKERINKYQDVKLYTDVNIILNLRVILIYS
jgi:hypothetical protein